MATHNATAINQSIAETEANHWAAERVEVASQATHQIESLLYALRRELNEVNESVDTTLMMTVVTRLKDLNSVAMSMLDNDAFRETAEMKKVVLGSWVGERT